MPGGEMLCRVQAFYRKTLATWRLAWAMTKWWTPICIHSISVKFRHVHQHKARCRERDQCWLLCHLYFVPSDKTNILHWLHIFLRCCICIWCQRFVMWFIQWFMWLGLKRVLILLPGYLTFITRRVPGYLLQWISSLTNTAGLPTSTFFVYFVCEIMKKYVSTCVLNKIRRP